jgi:LysR family transcriptional regulator, transcription activator of glutamate synthase operon
MILNSRKRGGLGQMDINQMKHVMAIAKYKNLSQASREVPMSQSSLSKQLRKLESELGGVRLFDRSCHNVKLTSIGEEFIKRASRIVADADDLQCAMKQYARLERGCIIVGAMPGMGHTGIISLVAGFQREYPGIKLEIKEAKTKELIELLQHSEVDVAFMTTPTENRKNIITYPFLEDNIVLVASTMHPLASKSSISLSETADERFIFVHSGGGGMYQICSKACLKAGFKPNVVFESHEIDTIMGLVAENVGVALLTSKAALSAMLPGVALIPLSSPLVRLMAIAMLKPSRLLGHIKVFLKYSLAWKSTHTAE